MYPLLLSNAMIFPSCLKYLYVAHSSVERHPLKMMLSSDSFPFLILI